MQANVQKVLEAGLKMDQIPKWFLGAKLNFAENILKFREEDKTAIISCGEGDTVIKLTWKQLHDHVERYAAALKHAGVTVGDRVVGYIPNCPEAVCLLPFFRDFGDSRERETTGDSYVGLRKLGCHLELGVT
jgi:hypothetical protein